MRGIYSDGEIAAALATMDLSMSPVGRMGGHKCLICRILSFIWNANHISTAFG